eukprot:NODE_564_length_5986_cov_1.209614.p4 type:complete len:113 gc:universal NODE_564_length_5986_cov_1.209614:3511-3849(+)
MHSKKLSECQLGSFCCQYSIIFENDELGSQLFDLLNAAINLTCIFVGRRLNVLTNFLQKGVLMDLILPEDGHSLWVDLVCSSSEMDSDWASSFKVSSSFISSIALDFNFPFF